MRCQLPRAIVSTPSFLTYCITCNADEHLYNSQHKSSVSPKNWTHIGMFVGRLLLQLQFHYQCFFLIQTARSGNRNEASSKDCNEINRFLLTRISGVICDPGNKLTISNDKRMFSDNNAWCTVPMHYRRPRLDSCTLVIVTIIRKIWRWNSESFSVFFFLCVNGMIHETGRLSLKRSVHTSKERRIIDHIVCTITLLIIFSPLLYIHILTYPKNISNKRGVYITDDEDTAIKSA